MENVFLFYSRNTSVGVCAFFTRFGAGVSPHIIMLVRQDALYVIVFQPEDTIHCMPKM